jgi:glycosyltransferase involved in cell wall biosynthesis
MSQTSSNLSNTEKPRVAFVVQRCGAEVNGGAELHCWRVAERMTKYWQCEILTTCAIDYQEWKNYYPPGVTEVSGITLRRFTVPVPRDLPKFNRLSEGIHAQLMTNPKKLSLADQEKWLKAQGPVSPDLVRYVKEHQDEYDGFFFFTYLYATSCWVLPIVAHKAYLLPLAHDEWPLKMSWWDSFFQKPRGFIFNTMQERDFLRSRFPDAKLQGAISGVAIDPPERVNPEAFRSQFGITDAFILYIGRIEPSKGCDRLFEDYLTLREQGATYAKLVLLGKPVMEIPQHPDIICLGFVEESTKWDALAACNLLIMPSPYESLSMVLLEAWTVGKPVVVNAGCEVLVAQCRRAQGGLWYRNGEELAVILEKLDRPTAQQLGKQGQQFVEANYRWEKIEQDYLDTLAGKAFED